MFGDSLGSQAGISMFLGGMTAKAQGGKFADGVKGAAIGFGVSYGAGRIAGAARGAASSDDTPQLDKANQKTLRVGQSRPMTEGEIAMAQEVFGGDVDYSKVKVFNRKFQFFQQRGVAMAPDGNIYFHPADYMDDFSASTMGNRAWFMHEMTHIWQRQQGVNVYAAMLDRRYDYRPLAPGKGFQSYGIEQQADIVRDYFLLRNGYRPQWSGHSITEYETILPFGR